MKVKLTHAKYFWPMHYLVHCLENLSFSRWNIFSKTRNWKYFAQLFRTLGGTNIFFCKPVHFRTQCMYDTCMIFISYVSYKSSTAVNNIEQKHLAQYLKSINLYQRTWKLALVSASLKVTNLSVFDKSSQWHFEKHPMQWLMHWTMIPWISSAISTNIHRNRY